MKHLINPAKRSRKLPLVEEASLANPPSRVEWLANIIRERIVSGSYKPGERMRERELQTEFGLSNGPVRDALLSMVSDGLAERSPWHGVRVIDLSYEEVVELFHVRLALMEYGAELAALRRTDNDIKLGLELKNYLDHSRAELQEGSVVFASGHLGQWIFAASGNSRLRQVWDKLVLQSLIYVHHAVVATHGDESLFQLSSKIIDAICGGDVTTARNTVRELTYRVLEKLAHPEASSDQSLEFVAPSPPAEDKPSSPRRRRANF